MSTINISFKGHIMFSALILMCSLQVDETKPCFMISPETMLTTREGCEDSVKTAVLTGKLSERFKGYVAVDWLCVNWLDKKV